MGNLLSSLPKTIHALISFSYWFFFIGLFYGNGGLILTQFFGVG